MLRPQDLLEPVATVPEAEQTKGFTKWDIMEGICCTRTTPRVTVVLEAPW